MTFRAPLSVVQRRGRYRSEIFVLIDADGEWICTTTDSARQMNLVTLAAQFNELHYLAAAASEPS